MRRYADQESNHVLAECHAGAWAFSGADIHDYHRGTGSCVVMDT